MKTITDAVEEFRVFYNDNKNGGSSRWLVSPETVMLSIESALTLIDKTAREEEREKIGKEIKVLMLEDISYIAFNAKLALIISTLIKK